MIKHIMKHINIAVLVISSLTAIVSLVYVPIEYSIASVVIIFIVSAVCCSIVNAFHLGLPMHVAAGKILENTPENFEERRESACLFLIIYFFVIFLAVLNVLVRGGMV